MEKEHAMAGNVNLMSMITVCLGTCLGLGVGLWYIISVLLFLFSLFFMVRSLGKKHFIFSLYTENTLFIDVFWYTIYKQTKYKYTII